MNIFMLILIINKSKIRYFIFFFTGEIVYEELENFLKSENFKKEKEINKGKMLSHFTDENIDYFFVVEKENIFKKSIKEEIEKILAKIKKSKMTPSNNYKIKQSTKLVIQKSTFEIRKLKD